MPLIPPSGLRPQHTPATLWGSRGAHETPRPRDLSFYHNRRNPVHTEVWQAAAGAAWRARGAGCRDPGARVPSSGPPRVAPRLPAHAVSRTAPPGCPGTLILCRPLLLLPSIFPSIRVFPKESVLPIRRPKYWSFSFSISPSNEHSRLISLGWTDWISLQSKGLSRVFSNITVQKHQLFGAHLSLWSNSHIHRTNSWSWNTHVGAGCSPAQSPPIGG